ncbi:MAG: efflux RND transporter periplasmic adaptor subunit [Longimicrobiales bacterium]
MHGNLLNIRLRTLVLGLGLGLLLLGSGACSSGGSDAAEAEEATERDEEHTADESGGRVTLSEASERNAGIEVSDVAVVTGIDAADGLRVPGRVEFPPSRVALISPRTAGRVERLTVVEGERVRAGEPVAYVLSPAFLTAQNDFIQAVRRADLLAGSVDEEGARSLAEAAGRRLQLLGASPALIERLREGGAPLDLLPIDAPFPGSIVEALILVGAGVEAGTPLFKIADLSAVDVVADVPEQALRHLEVGQPATVRLAAFPERPVAGRVERLRDELNSETRTLEAIIHVPNPERTLRPGMFATVELRIPSGDAEADAGSSSSVLAIPASAVVTDGGTRYVFVEIAPRTYERRVVTTGSLNGSGRLAVLSGLAAGERVVTRGAFTLKSELGKAAFGDEH